MTIIFVRKIDGNKRTTVDDVSPKSWLAISRVDGKLVKAKAEEKSDEKCAADYHHTGITRSAKLKVNLVKAGAVKARSVAPEPLAPCHQGIYVTFQADAPLRRKAARDGEVDLETKFQVSDRIYKPQSRY